MDRVKFRVNGVDHSVGSEVSSTTSLLEYLRRTLNLRGTKYMCLEGGCGACIVSAVKRKGDAAQGVNSCLVSITSCQDWEIETIEKIGNRRDGYHPLQKSLAEANGSQCGYCSPGMVMNMYSLLKSKKHTMLEIEESLASNVCRCTGYRPILKAFKKFASDAPETLNIKDIEDLYKCKKTGEICSKKNCDEYDWCFISQNDVTKPIHIELEDDRDFYKVYSLSDIFSIWEEKGTDSYMLVGGNTGKGVDPIIEYPKLLIDINSVTDLKTNNIDQNFLLGAGYTLAEVLDLFLSMSNEDNFRYLKVLYDHISLVAHTTVRNLGTIGGNLMLKNHDPEFKSDIFLCLETVGAEVTIMTAPGKTSILTMENFLAEDMTGKILLNIIFPPKGSEWKLVTFKIMPRAQSAHARIHAGFFYKISSNNKVLDCRIVYGGLSAPITRASETEKYLVNKELFTNETLSGAVAILKKELVAKEEPLDPPVEYKQKTSLGLFYKSLLTLYPTDKLSQKYVSGAIKLYEKRPVSEGSQSFDTDPTLWPLNKPMPKVDALLQCSGEAKYTDDVPTLPNEVFAAFVLTTEGRATLDTIDASEALKLPGVIAFYKASDIPGENSYTPSGSIESPFDEEILCDGEVKYYNQPYGIIVATSQHIAEKAVTLVKATYKNVKKPVIDIKVAKKDPTRVILLVPFIAIKPGIDIAKIITGDSTIYGQYHFTMETLACVTHPSEEGFKVYATTQWIDAVQKTIYRSLKLNQNRVNVTVRRLGGAYGLKISRTGQIAIACTLVSSKLNRPCRFIQSMTANMRVVGKRLPCSVDFELAVNKKGVIQYLNYDLYSDNGYKLNEPLLFLGVDLYNNCYKSEAWNYKAYNVVTDTASNTWCRAPGTLENVGMAEIIMERISYEMNLDPFDVRLANLDTLRHGELKEMADTIKASSQYTERKAAVEKFNSENRWKKRGLGVSFLRWTPIGPFKYGITLTVYSDDGSVDITHSGVDMGQGINTRAIQVCAYFLKIPIEKVNIRPNDTMIAPNGSLSGGSLTSQYITIGVRKGCEELLKRLEPIKKQLTNPTWEEIIKKAFESGIDLQVHSFVNLTDFQSYKALGITVAEVEVDGLTGEWQFIRVDLLEDAGRSINPEIDIGQIEGAFIMGVGYATSEELVYEPNTGEVLSDRTWHYYVPQSRDIPQDFRVSLRKRSQSADYIFGAKGVGEPATCMGIVVTFALRNAISAMRKESGIATTQWFQMDGPYTVDKIGVACAVNEKDFKFY